MNRPEAIELLSPAKDVACARAAIDQGADAVYIGASQFGARQAAANSPEALAELIEYAHQFGVRIYATVNTILTDDELPQAQELIGVLYKAGIDAIIIQDMGLLQMLLPPIPLHASTQMDNSRVEKVRFLADLGFSQVVLARELSLTDIATIHRACPEVCLEAFVHGALCVSYSGKCFVSEKCFGRSANRGACAQFCRFRFDLVDADGTPLIKDRHLLSLKDLNLSDQLEQMMDAGIRSFKIEGRLKDLTYVKNITAYYRHRLDSIFARRPEYRAAAAGHATSRFTPLAQRSFNRGFTTYFANGRQQGITSTETPKSVGEPIGPISRIQRNAFYIQTDIPLHNGDGLFYRNPDGSWAGMQINRAEGQRIVPAKMPKLHVGTYIYRNKDLAFEQTLERDKATRKRTIDLTFRSSAHGYHLDLADEQGFTVTVSLPMQKQTARKPQHDIWTAELSKWGNTPFELRALHIITPDNTFIPNSQLAQLRRQGLETLLRTIRIRHQRPLMRLNDRPIPYPSTRLDYTANIMNQQAETFYRQHGVTDIAPAFEKDHPVGVPLMYCKHCLRYDLHECPKLTREKSTHKQPYYLISHDGKRFRLEFDCAHCQMKLYATHETDSEQR